MTWTGKPYSSFYVFSTAVAALTWLIFQAIYNGHEAVYTTTVPEARRFWRDYLHQDGARYHKAHTGSISCVIFSCWWKV